MPLLSFSGTTALGPFWTLILDGKKTQTIRKLGKNSIKGGDTLSLYWKVNVPKLKKPIHFIGEAVCLEIFRKRYIEFAFDDHTALKNGFKDYYELQKWFGDPYDLSDEEYTVINFVLKSNKKNTNIDNHRKCPNCGFEWVE